MIAEQIVQMIEIHAGRLTTEVAQDLGTHERTPSFRRVPRADLEERLFQILHHLGDWIGNRSKDGVKIEFGEWGGKRFAQGVPLSEIVFAIMLLKRRLRDYIQQNGLIEAAFPRTEADYVLPMHLHSLQDLNLHIGQFFDEALYHLARGFEARIRQATPTR